MAVDIDKMIEEQENTIPDDNSMEKEQYAFRLAGDGNPESVFVNKILTIGEKNQAGVNAAVLRDGLPADSFTEQSKGRQEAFGWLKVSLVQVPKWAKELGKLKDDAVIVKLWNIVQEHELIFRGSR